MRLLSKIVVLLFINLFGIPNSLTFFRVINMNLLVIFLLCSSVFASETIDQKLSRYIQDFNLIPVAAPGPINKKLFVLGRNLFHEKRLSGNNNISCLECHHPRVMTHDDLPLSLGEGATGIQAGTLMRMQGRGKVLARNTPALFNLHNIYVMFWDGRVELNPVTGLFSTPFPLRQDISVTLTSALAAQAIFPLVDHSEMRGQKGSNPIADAVDEHEAWNLLVEKILQIPDYKKLFSSVFPGEKINIGHFGLALAEFQSQNFFFADTPYDRYIKGSIDALSLKQKLGMDLFFGKGKCGDCHSGEHLSLLDYDGVASPQIGPGRQTGDVYGRFEWDQDESSKYSFRVSPLRNVGLTAPYFHNGSIKKLEGVVEHYDDIKKSLDGFRLVEQLKNYIDPLKDHDHSNNDLRYANLPEDLPLKLFLSEEEKEALVEFMRYGLTDLRLHGNIKTP